eukprot:gene5009-115_t
MVKSLGQQLLVYYKQHFPFAMIAPSVHQICAHSWEMFSLRNGKAIAIHTEQSGEAWKKHICAYKSGPSARARQCSIRLNTLYVFTRMLVQSYPIIASKRKALTCKRCEKHGHTIRSCPLNVATLLTCQINEEIKYIKNENGDIEASLQYFSKEIEDIQAKVKSVEASTSEAVHLKSRSTAIDSLYNLSEYLENQSTRNNLKLLGMPGSESGETWDQSEKFFKNQVKESFITEEEIEIECAHRVGQKREIFTRPDGFKVKARPRPITAIIKNCKQKENIIKAARSIRLESSL